jgi:hypothetical protein
MLCCIWIGCSGTLKQGGCCLCHRRFSSTQVQIEGRSHDLIQILSALAGIVSHHLPTKLNSLVPMDSILFQPVPGLPGVVTCPQLRALLLGIVESHSLLCCISCPATHLLNVSTASAHIKSHNAKPPGMTANKIIKLVKSFNVYDGLVSITRSRENYSPGLTLTLPQLSTFPTPQTIGPCLNFLPLERAYRCILCQEQGANWFGLSDSSRNTHFGVKHHVNSTLREAHEQQVFVQSFCPGHSARNFFQVDPSLAPLHPQDEEDRYSLFSASPDALTEAFAKAYRPLKLERATEVTLKDTHPFLHHVGWAKHVSGQDPAWLCSLVIAPEEMDRLRPIFDAAIRVFRRNQEKIEDLPEPWRCRIMDDGSG